MKLALEGQNESVIEMENFKQSLTDKFSEHFDSKWAHESRY